MKPWPSARRPAALLPLGVISLVALLLPLRGQETNVPTAPKPAEPAAPVPPRVEPVPVRQTNEGSTASTPAREAQTNSVPAAKPASAASAPTYDSFRVIADRNIFDQSREPRVARAARSSRTAESRRTPRVESFALVGTMSYSKGTFAFFDGSSSQYKRTLKVGDSIGAYRVADVAPNQVKLAGEKQEVDLKVGQQMRREDDGEWQISARTAEFVSSGSSGDARTAESRNSAAESNAPAASAGSDSTGASDALKRLLEKREKELNQ